MERLRGALGRAGAGRAVVGGFLLLLLGAAGALGMDLGQLLGDLLRRWGMYGILALAMVPSVRCGAGLNFGIPIGILGGLLGGLLVIEAGVAESPALRRAGERLLGPEGAALPGRWAAFLGALCLGLLLAAGAGWLYGRLLCRMEGSAMTVTTYAGFAAIAFMNMVWAVLPFRSGELVLPNAGRGVRSTVSLGSSFAGVLDGAFAFSLGPVVVPGGLLLFFFLCCLGVRLFLGSRTGAALSAAGAAPAFARASGVRVERMRVLGVLLSTLLSAAGILAYSQSYGFLQLYNGPMQLGFSAVAAVLIGGADPRRASVSHAVAGTLLFQGILTLGLPVANRFLPGSSLSEVLRLILSNGVILYALTRMGGGRDG